MLYQAERHESLQTSPWDEDRVRATIQAIATDTETHFSPETFWPIHPLDQDFPPPVPSYKCLYLGAAGVFWSLHYLSAVGAVSLSLDPADYAQVVHDTYLHAPDTDQVVPSYYLGEVGILLIRWRLAPDKKVGDRLFHLIENNIPNPTNEAFWAAPGTMLGTLFMLEWTQEARWAELFQRNVEHLWTEWKPEPTCGCHLWTQDLYGSIKQYTGPAHGYVGNLYPLLRGSALLPEAQRSELYRRCVEAIVQTARVEGDYVNWASVVGMPPGSGKMLVQWCHGAPGMIASLCDFPKDHDSHLEQLLLQAGDLTWVAGPLTKGPGLCHGTAGNGYALLKLYQRTGDESWLQRARSFGMHAKWQYEQMRQQYQQGRYSLWTGDMGLAIYLWHCITGQADLPSLDIL